jgi:hypothetical protein
MKHRYFITRSLSLPLLVLLFAGLFAPWGQAKSKQKKDPPKEPGIYVISHLELEGATVSDIQVSDDPDRHAIELTGADGKAITLVDVNNPEKPRVVRQVQLPASLQHSRTQSRVGNAALFATEDPPSTIRPQLITLVSFSDPAEPKAITRFPGVTAILTDRARELIYMTNSSGLWILQIYTPADKRAEEQFDEMLRGSGG